MRRSGWSTIHMVAKLVLNAGTRQSLGVLWFFYPFFNNNHTTKITIRQKHETKIAACNILLLQTTKS